MTNKFSTALLAVSAILGAGTAYALTEATGAARAVAPAHGSGTLTATGGEDPPALIVELTATNEGAKAPADALEYLLDVRSQRSEQAFAQYVVEIVDDRGNPVVKPHGSGLLKITRDSRSESMEVVTTPHGLPDGFYEVRVTAAGASTEDEAAVIVRRYFTVELGSAFATEPDEWLLRSNANHGHVATPDEEMTK